MVGRLDISPARAREHYIFLGKRIFSSRKLFGEGRYKARVLERILKDVVQEATGEADTRMVDKRSPSSTCKTYEFLRLHWSTLVS